MPIPDFQSIMLPLLRLTRDGAEHSLQASRDTLADEFHLTAAEQTQLLPHANQSVMYNRVAWASSYLRYAGLLEATGRGRFRITARGQKTLAAPPERIDIAFLMQFEEFRAFRAGAGKGGQPVPSDAASRSGAEAGTPEEAIAANYETYRSAVEQELLERVKTASPAFFEQLVVDLLVAMGYGGSQEDAGRAVGQTGDGGIDGVVNEDRLGLDTIYLQAKRWEKTVGRPVVHAFAGSLDGQHARRGVLITTSTFSAEARTYVKSIEKRIVLVDGHDLARLMFEHGVGVVPVGQPYVLKRVDLDFFEAP